MDSTEGAPELWKGTSSFHSCNVAVPKKSEALDSERGELQSLEKVSCSLASHVFREYTLHHFVEGEVNFHLYGSEGVVDFERRSLRVLLRWGTLYFREA